MNESEIIRKSNTIFSTMVCPECGHPLIFEASGDTITAMCPPHHYYIQYDVHDIAVLLNNNGINCIVQGFSPNYSN